MKLLAAFLCVAAARKAPKKFESALEMSHDAPAIEASRDQLFCVAPPDAPAASLIFGSILGARVHLHALCRGGGVLGRRRLAEVEELPRDRPRGVPPRRLTFIPGSRRRRVCSHRTKWTLRCVAVALLHNAFKAPAAQFVVYAVLVALYARTRLLKMTGKKEYYREEKTE